MFDPQALDVSLVPPSIRIPGDVDTVIGRCDGCFPHPLPLAAEFFADLKTSKVIIQFFFSSSNRGFRRNLEACWTLSRKANRLLNGLPSQLKDEILRHVVAHLQFVCGESMEYALQVDDRGGLLGWQIRLSVDTFSHRAIFEGVSATWRCCRSTDAFLRGLLRPLRNSFRVEAAVEFLLALGELFLPVRRLSARRSQRKTLWLVRRESDSRLLRIRRFGQISKTSRTIGNLSRLVGL